MTSKFNHIHVWFANLYHLLPNVQQFKKHLSKEEMEYANLFVLAEHKEKFIVGRGQLRLLLSNYLNKRPQDILIEKNIFHKPFLRNLTLQFNVSHTQDAIYYAFAWDQLIGIDIEYMEKRNFDLLIDYSYSQSEQRQYAVLDLQFKALDFYRTWVCKEAILKALGIGLNYSLQEITIPPKKNRFNISIMNQLIYVSYEVLKGKYALALASNQKIKIEKYNIS